MNLSGVGAEPAVVSCDNCKASVHTKWEIFDDDVWVSRVPCPSCGLIVISFYSADFTSLCLLAGLLSEVFPEAGSGFDDDGGRGG